MGIPETFLSYGVTELSANFGIPFPKVFGGFFYYLSACPITTSVTEVSTALDSDLKN